MQHQNLGIRILQKLNSSPDSLNANDENNSFQEENVSIECDAESVTVEGKVKSRFKDNCAMYVVD